jgi:hypothetical protein
VHSGPLERGGDGEFAAGFDDAGGSTETLRVELWIAHALPIAVDVLKTSAGIVAALGMAAKST